MSGWALLDSGGGRKLERFGDRTLDRPCPQAVWKRALPEAEWRAADARFAARGGWRAPESLPREWDVEVEGLTFRLVPGGSGQVGLFPEHAEAWRWMAARLEPGVRLLNLFAHTGGATLAAARAGAEVCHVDASRPAVARARVNATASGLADRPVRWIVDDVGKFLAREVRRGRRYDAVALDPPAFGRGPRGERWKLDDVLDATLARVFEVLGDDPRFVFLSAHSQGLDRNRLAGLLGAVAPAEGTVESGDLELRASPPVRPVPSGWWAAWRR